MSADGAQSPEASGSPRCTPVRPIPQQGVSVCDVQLESQQTTVSLHPCPPSCHSPLQTRKSGWGQPGFCLSRHSSSVATGRVARVQSCPPDAAVRPQGPGHRRPLVGRLCCQGTCVSLPAVARGAWLACCGWQHVGGTPAGPEGLVGGLVLSPSSRPRDGTGPRACGVCRPTELSPLFGFSRLTCPLGANGFCSGPAERSRAGARTPCPPGLLLPSERKSPARGEGHKVGLGTRDPGRGSGLHPSHQLSHVALGRHYIWPVPVRDGQARSHGGRLGKKEVSQSFDRGAAFLLGPGLRARRAALCSDELGVTLAAVCLSPRFSSCTQGGQTVGRQYAQGLVLTSEENARFLCLTRSSLKPPYVCPIASWHGNRQPRMHSARHLHEPDLRGWLSRSR